MRAEKVAGWTAVIAGLLFVVGIAVASFAPAVASGGNASGAASPVSCTDDHMGAAGMGMMRSGHMSSGMVGSISSSCFGTGSTGSAPIPGAPEVRVQARNFGFTPSEIRLPKSDAVNLTLENPAATGVVHDLTVPALGIHVAANSGQTSTVGLRGLAAGRYEAYCSVAGHRDLGMTAVVMVE